MGRRSRSRSGRPTAGLSSNVRGSGVRAGCRRGRRPGGSVRSVTHATAKARAESGAAVARAGLELAVDQVADDRAALGRDGEEDAVTNLDVGQLRVGGARLQDVAGTRHAVGGRGGARLDADRVGAHCGDGAGLRRDACEVAERRPARTTRTAGTATAATAEAAAKRAGAITQVS